MTRKQSAQVHKTTEVAEPGSSPARPANNRILKWQQVQARMEKSMAEQRHHVELCATSLLAELRTSPAPKQRLVDALMAVWRLGYGRCLDDRYAAYCE